jgi:hypothetical protein
MKRVIPGALAALCVLGLGSRAQAQGDAKAIVDKAVAAIGGADKISKAAGESWKAKGTISFGGMESEFTISSTVQGLDKIHTEFEGDFGGNNFKALTVLNGKEGWRQFNDMTMDLDDAGVSNEKRTIYLGLIPVILSPLKDPAYKVEAKGEEKVDGKPANVLKVTAPDGKDLTLYLDRESGLPVKMVAVVTGFGGEDFTQENTFADYKDFNGIKKATKVTAKRDGEPFLTQTITEFKLLDTVDPALFKKP